jgi:hypothetical protein
VLVNIVSEGCGSMDPETIKLLAMIIGLVPFFSFFALIIIGLEVMSRGAVKRFRRGLRIYGSRLMFPELSIPFIRFLYYGQRSWNLLYGFIPMYQHCTTLS